MNNHSDFNGYQPHPTDTSNVTIPAELDSLSERLAEEVHELWAAQRVAEGWTYGSTRDDIAKHHPCLVPYAQLSESEKQYDRITASGTIKLILKLGYQLCPQGV